MIFKKIPNPDISGIIKNYELGDEIAALVTPKTAPDEFLKIAADNELYLDSVMFMAHALPIRESISWAYLTIAFLRKKFDNSLEQKAIASVEEWFQTRDENTRRKCRDVAEELKLRTGPAWLAESVFWSGGSILAPKDPVTEPPAFLYAKAVTGAISLAISLDEENADTIKENFIHSLRIAFNIAQGGNGQI